MDVDQTETQTTIPDTEPKATVLVPLYNYPLSDKTWQPLYEAYVWPVSRSPWPSSHEVSDLTPF
jgi:hypothetical protein